MTVTIDIPPKAEEQLIARAHAEGLSVDAYVRGLLAREGTASHPPEDEEAKRTRRLMAVERILEIAKGNRLGPDVTIRDLIEEGRRF